MFKVGDKVIADDGLLRIEDGVVNIVDLSSGYAYPYSVHSESDPTGAYAPSGDFTEAELTPRTDAVS